MREVISFIGQLSLVLVLLGLEQVYGVPLLAVTLTLYFSSSYPEIQRLVFLVLVGLVVAIFWHLAFTVGVTLVLGLSGAFILFKAVMPGIELRLLVVSLLGGLLTWLVALLPINLSLLSSMILSGILAWLLSRVLYQPRINHQTKQGRHR